MLRWGRVLRIAICSSVLCLFLTFLFNLKHECPCANPSANQQEEVLQKNMPSFCGERANGESNETVIDDGAVFRRNGSTTPKRMKSLAVIPCMDLAMLNSSEYVQFESLQTPVDHLAVFYHRILLSIKWKLNSKNLDKFRKELLKSTNLKGQDDFILTQRNTRDGDRLPYCYSVVHSSKKHPIVYYNVTQKFLTNDVPKVSPLSGRMFPRCSVVGNSGIIANSKCGQEIDQADYVIRANLPPIRPHTVDAGWKSNLTTMNPSIATKRFKGLKVKTDSAAFAKAIDEYYGVLWLPCISATGATDVCLKAKHTLELNKVKNLMAAVADPRHFLAIYNFWKERNLTRFLSTGFYLTNLALTMCEETHLYGFWPFPHRVPDRVMDTGTNTMKKVKYHYFDNLAGADPVHSMNEEFAIILQMHLSGLLHLHIKDCG